jgi:hypothetical protein
MATANTYLQVSELDFDEIRTNLKGYLSTQNQFKDYNFEGSAMSVLLDVLAYNTHYNSYYLNMVANEMFLDTAQQRDSVISRAKELGYLPVSAIGASANVTLTFSGIANTVAQFTIPKNSKFSTTIDDITYTYVTPEASLVLNSANTFSKAISIKEGIPLTHQFTVSSSNPIRYILPNKNIDTSSISVSVQESSSDTTTTEFTRATNIKQVFSTSPVFFLEESADDKYEIIFGQGALGKSLKNNNIVIVDYLVCNANKTNSANVFSVDSLSIGVSYTSATITTNVDSLGGRSSESIESIKFNAPRNYQTQNRAVVDNDYQRILITENADLQSVIAFGGEQAVPAVYGKVYIAVKPYGENYATNTRKSQIKDSISDRTPLGIDPVIIDPDYIYIVPTITTYYDKTSTTVSASQIESDIRSATLSYSTDNLERFGNKLRYSKFIRSLDNITTGSILNNDVSISLEKRFVPNISQSERLLLKFNNKIRKGTLSSTEFTYQNFSAYLDDDSLGNVNIYRYNDAKVKTNIITNAGTVDYDTGQVEVNTFEPTAFSDTQLKVSMTPDRFDVTPVMEQILIMDSENGDVTVTGETT